MSRAKTLKHAKSRRRRQKKAAKEVGALPRCPHGIPIVNGDFPWGCWFCLGERKKATVEKKPVIFPLKDGLSPLGAALVFLPELVPANCCDGRMVAMVVNRDGSTRCTMCDSNYVGELAVKEL